MQTDPPPGVRWIPGFHPDPAATDALRTGLAWRQESIRLFGRDTPMPRLTAWYGDPGAAYTYSGLRNEPLLWTPLLEALRDRLQDALDRPLNSVLANLYRDGRDHMGWHADDEPELGPTPTIASLSFGATRTFRMKHRAEPGRTVSIELTHGGLLVMDGRSQAEWLHAVPKRLRVTEPRINLTFRYVTAAG